MDTNRLGFIIIVVIIITQTKHKEGESGVSYCKATGDDFLFNTWRAPKEKSTCIPQMPFYGSILFFPESNQPAKVPRRFLTSDFYPALDQTGLSYIWEIKDFIKNY